MSEFIKTEQLINLDNKYLLVKRFKNQTFYYGRHKDQRKSTSPTSRWTNAKHAILFNSLEDATKRCEELNAQRQKLKYKVNKASAHFVSNFIVTPDYWIENLHVENRYLSIQDATDQKLKTKPSLYVQPDMIKICEDKFLQKRRQIEDYLRSSDSTLQAQIENLKQVHAQEYAKRQAELAKLASMQNYIDEEIKTGKLIDKYRTESDTKFQILYGDAKNVNS